ncbi:hypothetical protein [Actinosynnema mirum]|uniref:Scaffolding protein n=1 Tax=Actinosynnema mirum (strain ATCC 29888 / DSM 43827 / JCM 3225 / NBRC 14064 / NCIMB 13271 / NRRL B-12336 / IMRU 3971 / 101) TaxID=446462 RepID=C6WBM7_ACTMD|nr:hypothetical protein [Actinosynnema mirum]ACU35595.1 hypothetical protein Amir_1646 [Actinosynnema mirum DSM 43827]
MEPTPAAPSATTTTTTSAPAAGQQTAPVPTPPAAPQQQAVTGTPVAAGTPAAQPVQQATPAAEAKTFTQQDLDRILTERLGRQEKTLTEKFAQVFGITDPNAAVDPAKALADAQAQATAALARADQADARALAVAAGVRPEHVETFTRLVDLSPLAKLDRSDAGAVTAAIKAQVDAALVGAPMFKGAALPAASGGDRQGAGQASLAEQIAAAEKAGDFRTAISLKRQQAFRTAQ